MAGKGRVLAITLAAACSGIFALAQAAPAIPKTQVTSLTGQALQLPRDLATPATVLILGFGRHSQDATTAWERPVRTQLAKPGLISFYDMAMLAEVPGFIRPLVLRAIRHEVPDVLKPNFLPLTEDEDAWKRTAQYAADQPEAAYILLVDRTGHVQWSTHAPFSPAGFDELRHHAETLAHQNP